MLSRLFVSFLLSLVFLNLSSLALSNQLTYITYPDGVGITGCVDSSCPSELFIPEMIDGKIVTRIEEDALCYNNTYDKPDSITLPNSIKHIGESAFCSLDSIVLPSSVVSIYEPFSEISDIYIIRPADQNLNVFDFPADANLHACDGLDEAGNLVNCEDAYPDIVRNILNDDSASVMVDANGHVEIPDYYSWITEDAIFYSNVNSITVPNSVTYVEEESFGSFAGNIYIIKPAEQNLNVFHFPSSANIYACDGHDTEGNLVNCEEAYPDIVRNELDYDSALALLDVNGHLEIPNFYTMINDSALSFEGITSISLPDSIMHIPEDSLEYANLVSLIIPSSVVSYSDDSYLDVEGDIYIIKPANQYVNPYDLPNTSNHYVCESVDGSGNPVDCEDLWQSTINDQPESNEYATLDIDQNGSFDALTDGLILLRYAFGLRGDSLINGVIDTNANRTTAVEIEAYIQTLVP
ncbi:MAG: leucine-rich repeat protein [Porticoccaceae bacterium]